MKIYSLDLTGAAKVFSSADLYTLANANIQVTANAGTTAVSAIVAFDAEGQTIFAKTGILGGTSNPVESVAPSYYPKAVMGAECGAHVSTLSWADQNLNTGYQFVKTERGYFVAGVLNSTQTDANDPFDSPSIYNGSQQGVKQAACWDEPFQVTLNPFV